MAVVAVVALFGILAVNVCVETAAAISVLIKRAVVAVAIKRVGNLLIMPMSLCATVAVQRVRRLPIRMQTAMRITRGYTV